MSKIEWTNETINVITGCTKYSEGCQNCYAEKMHKRLTAMGQEKYKFPFSNVIFQYKELSKKFNGSNKMIFVNSMSDTFHEKITDEQILKIFEICKIHPQHKFQVLTKRAQRLPDFSYPVNVWLGVTVEKAQYKSRIELLKQTNAKIKFLSCEPLLEDLGELDLSGIDWVIVGGESGHNARPMHPDWVHNIKKQCNEQGVSFFFKQWGEWQNGSNNINKKELIILNTRDLIEPTQKDIKDFIKYHNLSYQNYYDLHPCIISKTGKKYAGCLLDDKEYKEYPDIKGEHHEHQS